MRRFPILALALLLSAGCREGRPGSGASLPAGGVPESGETLAAPEPGQLEAIRGQTDPAGTPGGEGEVLGAPADLLEPLEGKDPPAAGEADPPAAAPRPEGEGTRARFPRPEHVRGVYLNAWTAGSQGRRGRLLEMARRTEINTFVVDIKDASGYVSHPTQVALAHAVGATGEVRIRDLPALLSQLEVARIYPIARIVVAKDPILAEGRPDLAIQDSAGGPWLDQKEVKWLNFHSREVWDYHLDLAREVAAMGFPEIQWDYVRFPDAPESYLSRAVYPGGEGRSKAQAVREFLGYTREELGREGVLVTADVFGVTTSYRRDVGIGQVWESFIDQVDVALPMVYPSHYWPGSFGYEEPNAFPYEVVRRALRDATRRSAQVEGAGATRPWLQDFTLGEPTYGPAEIRAQIQAAYDVGIQEWILWNPGSRYTEAALIPARGLPSWLEPVMRVGGEVVKVSKRFQVLGEAPPEVGSDGTAVAPERGDPSLPVPNAVFPEKALPPVPIPDTSRAGKGGGDPAPGQSGRHAPSAGH